VADGAPGVLSSMSNSFFKWSGLTPWTDFWREGFGMVMSHRLANHLKTGWDGLDEGMRRGFEQYGINAADWKVLQSVEPQVMSGNKYVTGEDVARLGGHAELETKLRTYFVEESHFAVPEPGARERAFMLQGTRKGTLPGELLRTFWQFRSFPVSIMMKTWPRLNQMGVKGSVLLASQLWLMGYAAMSLKDISRGVAPPLLTDDWEHNAKIGVRALIQSGGMGVLGDLLYNDYRSYGRSIPDVVMGPTGELATASAKMFQGLITGDAEAAEAFNLLVRNTPYVNLFYTRAAVDYMFTYAVQEALNPGYLRRRERRMERDSGQEYFLPPSSAVRSNPIYQSLR
jgi:hypothetical protein